MAPIHAADSTASAPETSSRHPRPLRSRRTSAAATWNAAYTPPAAVASPPDTVPPMYGRPGAGCTRPSSPISTGIPPARAFIIWPWVGMGA